MIFIVQADLGTSAEVYDRLGYPSIKPDLPFMASFITLYYIALLLRSSNVDELNAILSYLMLIVVGRVSELVKDKLLFLFYSYPMNNSMLLIVETEIF